MTSEKRLLFSFSELVNPHLYLHQALYTVEHDGSDKFLNFAQNIYRNNLFSCWVMVYTHPSSLYTFIFNLFEVLFIKPYAKDYADNINAYSTVSNLMSTSSLCCTI